MANTRYRQIIFYRNNLIAKTQTSIKTTISMRKRDYDRDTTPLDGRAADIIIVVVVGVQSACRRKNVSRDTIGDTPYANGPSWRGARRFQTTRRRLNETSRFGFRVFSAQFMQIASGRRNDYRVARIGVWHPRGSRKQKKTFTKKKLVSTDKIVAYAQCTSDENERARFK